jgi:hypothetical protein
MAPGVDSASNRNVNQEYILRGKGGRCLGLKRYHLHVPIVKKLCEPQASGTFRTCPDLYRDCFTFTFYVNLSLLWLHRVSNSISTI